MSSSNEKKVDAVIPEEFQPIDPATIQGAFDPSLDQVPAASPSPARSERKSSGAVKKAKALSVTQAPRKIIRVAPDHMERINRCRRMYEIVSGKHFKSASEFLVSLVTDVMSDPSPVYMRNLRELASKTREF